ncbi:MAG: homogentisate 1,2-dioxygenase [Tatlockia sp.]|nr:homogentisate 1,2-dioxygenase [Tatlockia sp.]
MYLAGFGNHHQSEAIPNTLPKNQNSPQLCERGLYAEQLSGSAFTRPRHLNLHSWLYRILPSAVHEDYQPYSSFNYLSYAQEQAPNPFRWSPLPAPEHSQDFVDGLFHFAGNKHCTTYIYQCNSSMTTRYFSNNDGEMLLVPYLGKITLHTEFGLLIIEPGKIAVIPRGVKFRVSFECPLACGYLCENLGTPFSLPQLGFMGANALANPRHFLYPQASYKLNNESVTLICKYQNRLWSAKSNHSPLNVVAWHGNYAPYCYDLSLFNPLGTVSFDHPDPSIFTVLTSESETIGVANLDFVIFPPRWMVAEHSFRPPYFHRNLLSELMGLVYGDYDAKTEGFSAGGVSIHNCMTAHGPDTPSVQKAVSAELKPERYEDTLAFMFETCAPWRISEKALTHPTKQKDYSVCWQDLPIRFKEP